MYLFTVKTTMRRKLLRDLLLHLPLYHWILHKFLLTLTPPFFLYINSFHVGSLFLYPLKTENQKFSDIFTVGYRKHSVTWNRLKSIRFTSECLDILHMYHIFI